MRTCVLLLLLVFVRILSLVRRSSAHFYSHVCVCMFCTARATVANNKVSDLNELRHVKELPKLMILDMTGNVCHWVC